MATKKKSKTKVKTRARAKAKRSVGKMGKIKHRACSVCRKLGHNKRSHERGSTRGLGDP